MEPTTLTPTAQSTRVRKATAADIARIGSTLAGAFYDDPVFRWASPDDRRRREMLPGFFAVFAEAFVPHEESYVARPGAGAALWAPPGREPLGDEYAGRLEALLGEDAERMFEVVALLDEHHPHGSYYHLQLLGVDPASQGNGIGSALLANMLERADREGTPAYLEATSPDNKRLYERHGFRASDAIAPVGGPPLWPMWREPGA